MSPRGIEYRTAPSVERRIIFQKTDHLFDGVQTCPAPFQHALAQFQSLRQHTLGIRSLLIVDLADIPNRATMNGNGKSSARLSFGLLC